MCREKGGDGGTDSMLYSSGQMMHESGRSRSTNLSLVGIVGEASVEG
jgi:hypothetical protein